MEVNNGKDVCVHVCMRVCVCACASGQTRGEAGPEHGGLDLKLGLDPADETVSAEDNMTDKV